MLWVLIQGHFGFRCDFEWLWACCVLYVSNFNSGPCTDVRDQIFLKRTNSGKSPTKMREFPHTIGGFTLLTPLGGKI